MRIAGMAMAAALLAASGCKMPGSDASAKVLVFHQRYDIGDFDAIWNDSGPDIRTTATRDEFVKMLASVKGHFGKVREAKQTGFNVRSDMSGSTAEITMRTTFERGSGTEEFIYKGSGEEQKLAGYNIRPD